MYRSWLVDFNLLKKNYKGQSVPVVGGVVLIVFSMLFYYILYLINFIERGLLEIYLFIVIIIGLMGLLDDIKGSKESQGLSGHLKSLMKGYLTTGILKIIITLVLSILVSVQISNYNIYIHIINAAVITLMTNFLNLLDLRPGRSMKFFLIVSFLLILLKKNSIVYFLPLLAVFVFYFPFELKGRIMLGDSGANLLGAVLGFNTIIIIDSLFYKLVIMLFLLFMNIISEKISFSSVISRNRTLRWIDQFGR
ncbi:MAG: UDP-N-acetylmuramyl pentapeptide phosphotransferase [Halanaerobiales bacterium]